MRLELNEGQQGQVWHSLQAQLERYRRDLRTRYDGDPNFGAEDVAFLQQSIQDCLTVQAQMNLQGFRG